MLLEEIEWIEREQQSKEEEMEQWWVNFEADMSKEQDRLNAKIDDLSQEREMLQWELSRTMNEYGQREQELSARINFLTVERQSLEAKNEETVREMNSLAQNLENQRAVKTDDEVKWEAEREDLFSTVAKS